MRWGCFLNDSDGEIDFCNQRLKDLKRPQQRRTKNHNGDDAS